LLYSAGLPIHNQTVKGVVVLPTYNERENLPKIVPGILAHRGLRVLVVDDASPDRTAEVAQDLALAYPGSVELVVRTGPRGLGRSLAEGMLRALDSDADVIIQMDADLSHDPMYLPAMIAQTRQADLVIGSRYVHGTTVSDWPLRRIVLSVWANNYVRWILRIPVRDCTSGYRCWRRDALARLPLRAIVSEGYAFQVEMAYRAHRSGYRISEVPIVFTDRQQGRSKMSAGVIAESIVIPWLLPWRAR
jgi:dolichol-phosphate mannosyltransferase